MYDKFSLFRRFSLPTGISVLYNKFSFFRRSRTSLSLADRHFGKVFDFDSEKRKQFNIFVRMRGFQKTGYGAIQIQKSGLLPVFFFAALLLPAFGFSQTTDLPQNKLVDSRIEWLGMELDAGNVTLNYDIQHNGVVELRLFDAKGTKIWQNYYINEFGKNKIVLKRNKFTPGESYVCMLNYKTSEIKQTIVIPASGDNMAHTP